MARRRKMDPERKAFINSLLEHYQPKDAQDIQDMLKDLLGETLQGMLEAEMDDHLGYSKYDYKNKETDDSRNGYSPKTVTSSMGTINLDIPTSSLKEITTAVSSLYDRIIDKELLIRRLTLSAAKVMPKEGQVYQQLDLFTDYEALKKEQEKERRLQKSILDIKKKYGKNAVLRGLSYEEGATTRTRNGQIGGHKA